MTGKTEATPFGDFFRFKIGDVVKYQTATERDDLHKGRRPPWTDPDNDLDRSMIVARYVEECPGGFQPKYSVRPCGSGVGLYADRTFTLHEFEVKALPSTT